MKTNNLLKAITILGKYNLVYNCHFTAFCYIAENEGIRASELCGMTGLSQGVLSRIVWRLANYARVGVPYKLIVIKTSAADRRERLFYLSARGKKLVKELGKIK